ncbi:MAG: GntR family transcriptional regulator [Lachnospiraceae bacterium]|nr:GntR family transcriptional regulator [Lachnospiraceae bacterium]
METSLTNDEIYRILENEIAQLKILPGEVLSENTLCRRFQISRTPIRSVLQRLQQNGFVQILPHKGTLVTPISLKPATQWIFQRLAVECMVLRDFVSICTPTDIARVRYTHEQLLKITERLLPDKEHFDINEFLHTDLAMHRIWFQVTDRLFLWENLTRPQADYSRFIRLDIMRGRNVPDVLKEHQELIELIENKDLAAIEPLLRRHLYGGVRRMGSELFSGEYQRYFRSEENGG